MRDFAPADVAIGGLKYGLGLAALAWLLVRTDLQGVRALLLDVPPVTILAVLLVTVFGLVARFATWYVVLRAVTPVGIATAASIDLVVNFVNQLLPSRLTGRVAAPFVVRRYTAMTYADAAAVSAVHTALFAICYGLAALVGLGLAVHRLPTALVILLAAATGLYLLAGGFLLLAGLNLPLLEGLASPVASVARHLPRVGDRLGDRAERLPRFLSASTDAFAALATSPRLWFEYASAWSLSLLVASGLRVWLLLVGFGGSVQPAVFLPLYLVAAYSVTLLPITPGGIGITEVTATAVFVALGVPSTIIVPVVLIDRMLGVYLPALAGWYPSLQFDLASLSTE